MTARARRLRKDMTAVEQRLWRRLRNGGVGGLSFRRQHPVGRFVLDFYCPSVRMAIELDGGQHNVASAFAKDAYRTRLLAEQGITVIRFWNNDVAENYDGVVQAILNTARDLRVRRRTPTPALPLPGGGGHITLSQVHQ